ncbi:FAD/NAD(P)-binding protein [Actinoplanes rectilineatus]|uniref:FAD/NAD(P)-binding protein n=1 Tax=Actinoplanes rectilineatus TaxID=113571 RepID=UPI0005F2C9E6|nr:FAD/NAD(P)-binding protein [Actinoplanes rectilineatus]
MTSIVARRPLIADKPDVVAIIGGGFSGALTARAVLQHTDREVVLVSPEVRPGRGVAYGTAEPWHLLNSRAAAMSVDADDPQHLVRWMRAQGLPAELTDFVPRARYGDYLADQFTAASAAAGGRLRRHIASATAVRKTPDGYEVVDDSGCVVRADHVILAVGSPPPQRLPGISDAAFRSVEFVADPWAVGALDAVPSDEPVLLLGTGLTAIDVALSLTAGGRRTPIEALSRHGLVPQAHPVTPPPAVDLGLRESPRLAPLIRRVRQAVADGADWTAVMDHLRFQADRLWAALDTDAQERFLRHCFRHWETHRHRMAPPIAARVAELRAEGTLRVRSGRMTAIVPDPDGGLIVHIEGEEPRRYGAVITCSGPGPVTPRVSALIGDDSTLRGPHGLGIDTDDDGRVLDADGRVQPGLWLVGPLRRGRVWEATAVPEIRGQVDRMVAVLPARLPTV